MNIRVEIWPRSRLSIRSFHSYRIFCQVILLLSYRYFSRDGSSFTHLRFEFSNSGLCAFHERYLRYGHFLTWSISEFIDQIIWFLFLFLLAFIFSAGLCSFTKPSNSPVSGSRSRWAFIASNCSCYVARIEIRRLTRKFGDDKISFRINETVESRILLIIGVGMIVLLFVLLGRFVGSSSVSLFSSLFVLGSSGVVVRDWFSSCS